MKKLYKLRKWLTTEEAARHLSVVLGEEVMPADLFRLAADGHLRMSVNLVNKTLARLGRVIPFKDMPMREFPFPLPDWGSDRPPQVPDGKLIDDVEVISEQTRFVYFEKKVSGIDGVWDLTMKGAEARFVEQEYQRLAAGLDVELPLLGGLYLSRDDGQWAHLQEQSRFRETKLSDGTLVIRPGDYFSADKLSAGSQFVVTMEALAEFQARCAEPKSAPPGGDQVGVRERETLLKLVIGMAVEAYRYVPSAARSSIPGEIAADLAKHGISITDDTVRKYLKEAAATVLPGQGPRDSPNSVSD